MQAPLHNDIADAPDGGVAYWVETPDGKRIRYAVWHGGQRGTVLVFPGRSEYIEKYGRVVSALVERGFSCLVIDWRGQGLSTRPNDSTAVGHVDNFSEYQSDLNAVLDQPEAKTLPRPHVLLAHSMGGCIGLRALHEGLDVQSAIFSAPMWRMGFNPAVYAAAQVLSKTFCAFGRGLRHATGTGPGLYILKQKFEGNVLTNDRETYEWMQKQLSAYPELGLGGPSMSWVREALAETKALAAMPPPCPALTFLGDEEAVVSSDGIRRQMAKPNAGKLVVCPKAQHEILMETGIVQDMAWSEIDAWLAKAEI